jgi:hypothetical protein
MLDENVKSTAVNPLIHGGGATATLEIWRKRNSRFPVAFLVGIAQNTLNSGRAVSV